MEPGLEPHTLLAEELLGLCLHLSPPGPLMGQQPFAYWSDLTRLPYVTLGLLCCILPSLGDLLEYWFHLLCDTSLALWLEHLYL